MLPLHHSFWSWMCSYYRLSVVVCCSHLRSFGLILSFISFVFVLDGRPSWPSFEGFFYCWSYVMPFTIFHMLGLYPSFFRQTRTKTIGVSLLHVDIRFKIFWIRFGSIWFNVWFSSVQNTVGLILFGSRRFDMVWFDYGFLAQLVHDFPLLIVYYNVKRANSSNLKIAPNQFTI